MSIDVRSSNVSSCDLQANTAAFEACSKERIQPFDDDEEDIWEEKEIKFATQTKSRNRSGARQWGGTSCESSQQRLHQVNSKMSPFLR